MLSGLAIAGAVVAYGNKSDAEAEPIYACVEILFAEEMKDGEMRSLKVGDKDDDTILISRYRGKLYATGNFCSNFGC